MFSMSFFPAPKFNSEKNRRVKRIGKRNEAPVTRVYAYAAAQQPDIRVYAAREYELRQLENMLQPRIADFLRHLIGIG